MHFKRTLAAIVVICSLSLTAFAQSVYTIKSGDTLSKIAAAKQIALSDILKANPNIKNPAAIMPGQKINIPAPSSTTTLENQVITLVNQQRASHGLQTLSRNATLAYVARLKSQDMASKNYFSHTSPTYGSPFTMMQYFGIKFTAAGENIAMGQPTPQAVMTAWMNSPGHRANILSPAYNQIGVGLAKSSSGVEYWTQDFIKIA
jgi:uncharacterized YkwD family protein